jgi:hypothetical protein
MPGTVVVSVKASIRIASFDPGIANAQIPDDLVSCIYGSALIWSGVDTFFFIKDVWPEIEKAHAVSLLFAQQSCYARAAL